jgi:hypothetical protein
MDTVWTLAALAVVVVAALWWLLRRGRSAEVTERSGGSFDALDTLQAWQPTPTRVLTGQERLAYAVLVKALPEYIILAQVPLSRFLKVPTRNSYAEWLARVGSLCADLLVCDHSSQVVAVVDVRMQPHQASERNRQRHERIRRVLKAAGIPLHVWYENALPTPEEVREAIAPPAPDEAFPTRGPTAQQPPSSPPAAPVRPVAVAVAPEEMVPDEIIEMHEPLQSTWYDNLEPLPTPARRSSEASPGSTAGQGR